MTNVSGKLRFYDPGQGKALLAAEPAAMEALHALTRAAGSVTGRSHVSERGDYCRLLKAAAVVTQVVWKLTVIMVIMSNF